MREKGCHKKVNSSCSENLSIAYKALGLNLSIHHKTTNNIMNCILAEITDFARKFSSLAPELCIKNLTMLKHLSKRQIT